MHSFEQRKEVEKLIENGITIQEISEKTQISKPTLYNWKKEYELKQHIEALIKQGKIDEVIEEMRKINTKYGREYTTPSLMAKLAKENGDRKKEKEYLIKRLDAIPSDVKAMSSLIRIAREEGDREEEKKLLLRILEIEPNDTIAMGNLIKIAREEGDREEEKRLLLRLLEIEPNDIIAMSSLIRIAREEGDREGEKRLLLRQLEIEPNNVIAMRSLIRIAEEEKKRDEKQYWIARLQLVKNPNNMQAMKRLEGAMPQRKPQKKAQHTERTLALTREESQKLFKPVSDNEKAILTPTEQARKMIHQSENILEVLEPIANIIQQEPDKTIRTLIQAEAAMKAGLNKRAEALLKGYKKISQGDPTVVKTINQALQMVSGKKIKICDRIKWENLHKTYAEARKKEEVSTDSNSDGR